MGGWGGIEEPELEEGEAADDDTSIDPDIALSHIEERLRNVLGHVQKDFEGGVSAENLGAKFGGYGSFLPMYQRSPPACSQPRTPPRVQNLNISRSPGNLLTESGPQNFAAPLDAPVSQMRQFSASTNSQLLHNSKSMSGDGSVRQESCLITENVSNKHEPCFSKSINPPDQKKLTVRIKMSSDKAAQENAALYNNAAEKNAALYSGLGLASPSSSTGNSPEESWGTPFSSREIPSESPASILQILTSFLVSEDLLLSPLHENLLNLISSGKASSVDSKTITAVKRRDKKAVSSIDISGTGLGTGDVLKGKKSKFVGLSDAVGQPTHENQVCSQDGKTSASETLESKQGTSHEWNGKTLSDSVFGTSQPLKGAAREPEAVRQHQQNMPVKKREINKNKVKDRFARDLIRRESIEPLHSQDASKHEKDENQGSRSSLAEKFEEHGVINSQKGVLIDRKEDSRCKVAKIPTSLRADSDISEGKLDSMETMDCLKYKGPKAASHEHDKSAMPNVKKSGSKRLPSEGKKLKGSQINGKPTSGLADASLKSGVSAIKKSTQKDVNKVRNSYKDLFDTRVDLVDDQADRSARPSVDKSKDRSHDGFPRKRGIADKNKESSGLKRFNQLGYEMPVKEPLAENLPSTNGVVETAAVAPAVIEEHWVCCDNCETWRLLPPGITQEQLPEKWSCSMSHWLPGMNRCGFSEDETAQAVRAKYWVLESQNNLQNNSELGLLGQTYQNGGSHHMTEGKVKLKSQGTFHKNNSPSPIMNLHLMKGEDALRGRNVKDMSHPSPSANLINKSSLKNPNKQMAGSSYLEEEDVSKGEAKRKKKIKRERESDQHGQGRAKKIKTEIAINMDDLCTSEYEGHLGRAGVSSSTGLPSKVVVKEMQKQLHQRESEKEQISAKKKRRDSLQGSLDSGYTDVKTDGRDISIKKRRVLDGQDYFERVQSNGNHFRERKVSLKEDSGDSGFRREKKLKVLGSEGKGFTKTKVDVKATKGGAETTMLISGSTADTVDKNIKKAQQLRAKLASGLTLEDVEALKKDLGSEQLSTAATSSSSKVSDSRRSRANYQEVKGSPVESVSSSPMRTSTTKKRGSKKDDSEFGNSPAAGSRRRSLYTDDIFESNQSGTIMKERGSNVSRRESFRNCALESQETIPLDKHVTALSCSGAPHLDAGNSGRRSACPSDVHATARHSSKARISKSNHNHMLKQPKSGVVSSARTNENDKASSSSFRTIVDKVSDLASDREILHQKRSLREETGIEHNLRASCPGLVGESNHPFSDEASPKAFRNDNVLPTDSGKGVESGKLGDIRRQSQPKHRECDGLDMKMGTPTSVNRRTISSRELQDSEAETANKRISNQVEARNGKLQDCSHGDNRKGSIPNACKTAKEPQRANPLVLQSHDASAGVEGLKTVLKTAGNGVHQNGSLSRPASDQSLVQDLSGPSHTKKEAPTQSASSALSEAEELRTYADRLKESGFAFECNEAYFQAALMFLRGAALLEGSNVETNRHGEMNQIQIYSSAARLCEACALEFEKRQEMAAAALAYKCVEVAYMRVVYCKNLNTNRVWHDLQANLQMIPQSESPSSSASDIDNLNNQVATKGNGSLAGNHIIAPRNRPNVVRMLDFTKDVNSAMEASRKSLNAFAAADSMMLEQVQNKEFIISVKRVIDFSFQDVEELVRMVKHAIRATSRGGSGAS